MGKNKALKISEMREASHYLSLGINYIDRKGAGYVILDEYGNTLNGGIEKFNLNDSIKSEIELNGYAVGIDNNQVIFVAPHSNGQYILDVMGLEEYVSLLMDKVELPNNYAGQYYGGISYYLYDKSAGQPVYALKNANDIYTDLSQGNMLEIILPDNSFDIQLLIKPSSNTSPYIKDLKIISFSMFLLSLISFVLTFIYDLVATRRNKMIITDTAMIDSLTGLNNISALDSWYKSIKKDSNESYFFVCLDVVSFKNFNDVFGIMKGDSLLISIADTLKENFGNAIRAYGDTFAFVVKESESDFDRIRDSFYTSIEKDLGCSYKSQVFFKFGVYPINDDSQSSRYVYDQAMSALRLAKKQSRFYEKIVYDPLLQKEIEHKKVIEENMYNALKNGEFILYIQPKCNLYTGLCSGGEALVRWDSKKLGFTPPDQFIHIFEENGFIVELDFFVLESALNMQQKNFDLNKKILPISVNQSKVTIMSPAYLDRVKMLIEKYSFPFEYIEIEVTESALENNFDNILTIIKTMRSYGFLVDMDDFGSGFSSLNALKHLPIDVLKIDRGFLKEYDEKSRKIIKNIVNLTKELGIIVLCEGVETEHQYELLKTCGCDYIQGYYYSRPVTTSEYEDTYIKPAGEI
ncbi:MAG: GGDEF domain-containing phosphodiesterase [Clostridiales bacterium]|nr:GGDEF domain-containing phosphodiesterase [Clostridiales bacterium]